MNPSALLVPSLARLIPDKTKERSLALHSIRQLWHILFDPCPLLSKAFPDNGDFWEPFLEYAASRSLSMGWPLHGHALLWLGENRPAKTNAQLRQELFAAAAARWANSDQSGNKGILLHFTGDPKAGLAGWKCRTAREEPRVVLLKLPKPELPSQGIFAAAFPGYQYDGAPLWRPLPD